MQPHLHVLQQPVQALDLPERPARHAVLAADALEHREADAQVPRRLLAGHVEAGDQLLLRAEQQTNVIKDVSGDGGRLECNSTIQPPLKASCNDAC